MLTLIKILLERLTNYTTTDDLIELGSAVYGDANKDPQLED